MAQSATAQDMRDELLDGLPAGFGDLLSLTDEDGPGPLLDAMGEVIATAGVDRLDDLRDQLCPLTCSVDTLAEWEQALHLVDSRVALGSDVELRRAQVMARLRERGAPTLAVIRAVVYKLLGYSSPADVVILESDRAALRALHTYRWRGSRTISGAATLPVKVADGGAVGPGGAQVDIGINGAGDWSAVTVNLVAPDGTTYGRTAPAVGAPSCRGWSSVASGTASALNAVWGDGSSVWFVGASGTILRWDGSAIAAETSGTAAALNGVWGNGSVVYAVGANTVLKRSGGTWSAVTSPAAVTFIGVFALGSAVWVCGASGNLWKSTDGGSTWTQQTTGTAATLRSIWGPNALQLWCVGSDVVLATDDGGATWTTQATGVGSLFSVRGTSPWDVWAVGSSDVVLRYGPLGAWTTVSSSTGASYRGVAPTGRLESAVAWPTSTQVWTCGTGGALAVAEHDRTDPAASGTLASMAGLWAVSETEVWACGSSGVILRMTDTGDAARVRVYFPEAEGKAIAGTWTVIVSRSSGTLYLASVDLFVEGFGLEGSNNANGRGTAAAWWGVMFEPAKSSGSYDLDAARLAVARLTMACRWSNILRRSEGGGALAAGDYAAIPGDPAALPGGALPGT